MEKASQDQPQTPPQEPAPGAIARRGVLGVGGAKVLFVLLGLVTNLAVPRLLGSTQVYGQLTAVTTAIAILTNTLTAAIVQTASKLLSEEGVAIAATVRRLWRFALGLGLSAGAFLAALALPLAHWVFGDPALGPLFLVGSLVLVAVPLYSAGIGMLNGQRSFGAQARLDAGFSVARTVGLCGGAVLGIGALGPMAGYTTATLVMAGAAVLALGTGAGGAGPDLRRIGALLLPIAVTTIAINAVLQLDVELLKAVSASVLRAAGETAEAAAEAASDHVGIYRATQQLAMVPYQLSIALTLVVFPLVSHATSSGDVEAARRAIRGALRFAALWLVLCEGPLAGTGGRAIDLIFPEEYVVGADALAVLCVGQILFALFALACTVLTGAGRVWQAAGAALAGAAVVVLVTTAALYAAGPSGPLRIAAATGALLGAATGLGIALAYLRALFGAVIPWGSFARAAIAGIAGALAARFVPLDGAIGAIAALAAGAVAYVAVLAALGELRGLGPPPKKAS